MGRPASIVAHEHFAAYISLLFDDTIAAKCPGNWAVTLNLITGIGRPNCIVADEELRKQPHFSASIADKL
jgi:hypothetical protein